MKILETTIGSSQYLIHCQRVGKKEGAPMIWIQRQLLLGVSWSMRDAAYTKLTKIRSRVSG